MAPNMANAENKQTEPTMQSGGKGENALFPRDALIGYKGFRGYHPDILKALLPKPNYTKKEAIQIVSEYFKNFKKEGN